MLPRSHELLSDARYTLIQREPILVSLSPSGVRVAIAAGGEISRVHRVMLDPDTFEAGWQKNLQPFDDALRTALNTLQVRPGSPALVLYHGPHSVADVFHAPASGPAALRAADLYLQQTLPNVQGGWLTALKALAEVPETPVALAGTAPAANAKPGMRTLMLTVADSANDGDMLAHWLRRCGLRAVGVLPTKAAMLHQAMTSDPMSASAQPRVYVHMGEHAMTISGWVDGKLCLARCAEVGYSLLCDAMYRSGRGQQLGDVFTRDYATRLAFSVGIPKRGEMMDQGLNFRGDDVLPLVQPALQRFAIELRQTLRFGMLESDLARVKLWITGPGSAITGIGTALGDSVDLASECLATRAGGAAEDQVGDLALALVMRQEQVWMTPPSTQLQSIALTTRKSMRAGVAVAVLALGAMGINAYLKSRAAATQIATLQPRAAEIESRRTAESALTNLESRETAINTILSDALGERPTWRAPLVFLSQATEAGVEFVEITGDYGGSGKDSPTLTLRGRAPNAEDDGDPILKLLAAIKSESYVEAARIVSTQAETGGTKRREFVMSVQLKGVAFHPSQAAVASAEEAPAQAQADLQPGMQGATP